MKGASRLIILAWCAWLTGVPCEARVWPVVRVVQEERLPTRPSWYEGDLAIVGHVPSTRNLLGLERTHRYGLPTAESAASAKTVRVAVLRVQFRQEIPDDPRTTGDGHIDMRPPDTFLVQEGHGFEQSPHNRDFFATIMRAMVRYYDVVSNNRLTIVPEVFPLAQDSAYTLDSSMCWYGGLPPNEGLAYLLIDAVRKADTDPDLVFADHDAIILFHAGSDQQHNFAGSFTPTPCDLFTGYLRLLEDSLFVVVDGGADTISDGVILPETASQDNRATGLNGLVAHEFGHQLGLVDLYNTATFFPQVGDFSLMDNDAQQMGLEFPVPWEINTLFDALPVFPDAWSRAFLGFVDPIPVTPDSILAHRLSPDSIAPYEIAVAEGGSTVGSDAKVQVLGVPITAKEYFLLEFRSPDQDLNADPTRMGDQGVGIRFDSTFTAVLGPAVCNPSNPGDVDSCRPLGRDYDFQFFSPGDAGGLMIWHVDEEVAYQSVPEVEADPYLKNNFDGNALQWNPSRRFVEVEEADGIVDFGGDYITTNYYGGQRELFVAGYNSEFGPATNPSTRSHTGAPSHLRFFDISPVYPPNTAPPLFPNRHLMRVKIANERAAAGWPRAVGRSDAPQLTVLRGNGGDTVLAASGSYVLGWTGAGDSLFATTPDTPATARLLRVDGSYQELVLTGFARADTELVTQPSVSSGSMRLVSAVDARGKIYIWSFADTVVAADGWADVVGTFDIGTPAPQPPMWFDSDGDGDDELFVAPVAGDGLWWEDGAFSTIDVNADSVRDWALLQPQNQVVLAVDDGLECVFPPTERRDLPLGRRFESMVAVDYDRNDTDAVFAREGHVLYRVRLDGAPRIDAERDPVMALHGPLVAGDHDDDGRPSVFAGAGEWLAGFQPNLAAESNYPLRGNDVYVADPVCEAIMRGALICFGGADGEVQGYTPTGEFAPGWPLYAGDTVVSLATVRRGADSTIVLARSTNGYTWGTQIAGPAVLPGAWTQSRADAHKQNRWDPEGVPQPVPEAASLAPERVFAYPNPAPRGLVRIRYYLAEASSVELTIYDLAGNEVTSETRMGDSGDNDWEWNAAQIVPGVYLCRVQARQSGRDIVEFCKVAIIP